jgi:hypothetical protein
VRGRPAADDAHARAERRGGGSLHGCSAWRRRRLIRGFERNEITTRVVSRESGVDGAKEPANQSWVRDT